VFKFWGGRGRGFKSRYSDRLKKRVLMRNPAGMRFFPAFFARNSVLKIVLSMDKTAFLF